MEITVVCSGAGGGHENMSTDRQIAQHISEDQTHGMLRWYTWSPPAFSLGYGQKAENLFDMDRTEAQNLDCCKRPTGGSVVYHSGDLSYSLTIPRENPWGIKTGGDLYGFVNGAFVTGLREMGIPVSVPTSTPAAEEFSPEVRNLCLAFHSPGDILLNGKKLGGSAQRRLRKVWQQQGFLLFSPFDIPSCFKNPQSATLMKSQSTDFLTSGYFLSMDGVREKLTQSLVQRFAEASE